MKSIGVWYKVCEEECPQLEFHINLWNLKKGKKNPIPFIDLGVGIPQFRKIKSLDILLPFEITETEIVDLYEMVKEPDTARLIFNEIECEIASKDRYVIIQSDNFENAKWLINIKKENALESFVTCSKKGESTCLSLDFTELKKDSKFSQYDDLYLRFRLNSESIKRTLFCPIHKKNWFLESGFVETQIVDIKVNQERNLPHNICKDYRVNKYSFASFKKIHLLVMSDSRDDVESLSGMYECRKLEEQGWDDYLGNNYDVANILAYHWKEKSKDGKGVFNFSKLIRISTASTNKKVIVTYMIVVVLLGALGGGLLELLKFLFVR